MNEALHSVDDTPSAQAIGAVLREKLTPTELVVEDESQHHIGHAGSNGRGSGTHFRVSIASPLFAGLSRVQCHRLVYGALHDFFAIGLHALAIEVRQQ